MRADVYVLYLFVYVCVIDSQSISLYCPQELAVKPKFLRFRRNGIMIRSTIHALPTAPPECHRRHPTHFRSRLVFSRNQEEMMFSLFSGQEDELF